MNSDPQKSYVPYAVFAALLSFHAYSLLSFPPPFADEPLGIARSLALVRNNIPFGALDLDTAPSVPRPWATFFFLPVYFGAVPVVLGASDLLLGLRLVSLVFGVVLLLSVYRIVRQFGSQALATWALAVTGLNIIFAFTAHVVRPDIMAAALGYLALAVYVTSDGSSTRNGALAGVLFCLAIECHPRAFVIAAAFPVATILQSERRSLFERRVAGWILGGLFGAAVYCAVHILPDPASFFASSSAYYGKSQVPAIIATDWSGLLEAFMRLWSWLPEIYGVCMALALVSSLLAVRTRGERALYYMGLSIAAAATVLIRSPREVNLIVVTPAFDILAALTMHGLLVHCSRSSIMRRTGQLLAAVLLFTFVVTGFRLLRWGFSCEGGYPQDQAFINSTIGSSASAIGPEVFWMGRPNSRYTIWEFIPMARGLRNEGVREAVGRLCPEYLILDGGIRSFFSDVPGDQAWWEQVRIPKTEMEEYLSEFAEEPVGKETLCRGRLEVFRLKTSNCLSAESESRDSTPTTFPN